MRPLSLSQSRRRPQLGHRREWPHLLRVGARGASQVLTVEGAEILSSTRLRFCLERVLSANLGSPTVKGEAQTPPRRAVRVEKRDSVCIQNLPHLK